MQPSDPVVVFAEVTPLTSIEASLSARIGVADDDDVGAAAATAEGAEPQPASAAATSPLSFDAAAKELEVLLWMGTPASAPNAATTAAADSLSRAFSQNENYARSALASHVIFGAPGKYVQHAAVLGADSFIANGARVTVTLKRVAPVPRLDALAADFGGTAAAAVLAAAIACCEHDALVRAPVLYVNGLRCALSAGVHFSNVPL